MEETPASQKMAKIDLINILEKISSEIPDRILKLEGSMKKDLLIRQKVLGEGFQSYSQFVEILIPLVQYLEKIICS